MKDHTPKQRRLKSIHSKLEDVRFRVHQADRAPTDYAALRDLVIAVKQLTNVVAELAEVEGGAA